MAAMAANKSASPHSLAQDLAFRFLSVGFCRFLRPVRDDLSFLFFLSRANSDYLKSLIWETWRVGQFYGY
jgi:hypothetical protein